MRVYIVTEGGKDIGFGHITRCSSLDQAFRREKIIPEVVVNKGLKSSELSGFARHSSFNWLKEKDRLYDMIDGSDVVVVDSYLAPRDIYEKISRCARRPVFIDDYKRLSYPNGIVVNGSVNAEVFRYPRRKGVRYLLGSRYIPVRKVFRKRKKRRIRRSLSRIMVTFGGYDGKNMTPFVLKALKDNLNGIKKRVISGKYYGDKTKKEIKRHMDADTELIKDADEQRMRDVMLDSDLAVSAGGQTLYELAATGTPAIAICVADNQSLNLKGFEAAGAVENIGWHDSPLLDERLSVAFRKLSGFNARSLMSGNGRRLVDGMGAFRIIKEIGCGK